MQGQRDERGRMLRELLPWAPTVLGVLALIALLVIAATRFASAPEAIAVPPALPAPAFSPPAFSSPASSAPAVSAPAVTSPVSSAPAPASGRPSAQPSRRVRPATVATSPSPSPGLVSGRYRVVDSYDDAFIGEVLVTNSARGDRGWRVELRFPAGVGDLITSWVESAPQATLRRSGPAYIWTSGVPVPAGGRVELRFHFSRTGGGDLPSACAVNGVACAGAR